MASLQARFINWILPLRGSRHRMADAGRMAVWYARNAPVPAPPPSSLMREFVVVPEVVQGMRGWRVTSAPANTMRILYVHGGAYVNELVRPHWSIVSSLARQTGATVHVPLYPLAPTYSWQDAFGPLLALMRQLRSEAPTGQLVIAGDSAGAGLALAMCQVLRDARETLPDRVVLLSPFLDARVNSPEQHALASKDRMLAAPGLRWAAERWARDIGVDDPRVSPLNGSLEGLPPILVLTGTSDLLHTDAKRLRDKGAACGAQVTYSQYEDMFHVWMGAPIPEAAAALHEVATFLKDAPV